MTKIANSNRIINTDAVTRKAHPNKFNWFANQEGGKNGYWKESISYQKIKKLNFTGELNFYSTANCSSGFCGV